MSPESERVYDVNGADVLRLDEVDLHDPLTGLEIMADCGDEYATITLDMQGVIKLRRFLQRLERKVARTT